MNKNSVLISILLVALVAYGWYSFISSTVTESAAYDAYVKQGDAKFEKELYQEAGALYEAALNINAAKEIEDKIISSYQCYYEERMTSDAQSSLISALSAACTKFPQEVTYREQLIAAYMEAENYDSAYSVCQAAYEDGLESEIISAYTKELTYSYQTASVYYSEYKNAVNGYFIVYTGTQVRLMTDDASESTYLDYQEMGYVGDNEIYLYKAENDNVEFIDLDEIVRGKVHLDVSDFGMYSEGYCAVQYEDSYCIIDLDGNILMEGLQYAGCFQNGKAVVQNADGQWALISTDGEYCSDFFEEIKTDYAGRYVFHDIVLAKQDGKYQLYDENLEKTVSDFEADDVDCLTEADMFAYSDGSAWGYADYEGTVKIEPEYEEANSFSYGLAAVCVDDKWGYINESNELVIDAQFYEAGYLSEDGVSFISDEKDYYTTLTLRFPKAVASQ